MRGSLFLFWIINVVCFQFQFMPLHERQRSTVDGTSYSGSFQFTPLHERQRYLLNFCIQGLEISIHASAWEATDSCCLIINRNVSISIHASAWEATRRCWSHRICALIFQFTPLHERQPPRLGAGLGWVVISIHASAWEATDNWKEIYEQLSNFNSRLCMRGNIRKLNWWNVRLYFNSRLCMRGNVTSPIL